MVMLHFAIVPDRGGCFGEAPSSLGIRGLLILADSIEGVDSYHTREERARSIFGGTLGRIMRRDLGAVMGRVGRVIGDIIGRIFGRVLEIKRQNVPGRFTIQHYVAALPTLGREPIRSGMGKVQTQPKNPSASKTCRRSLIRTPAPAAEWWKGNLVDWVSRGNAAS